MQIYLHNDCMRSSTDPGPNERTMNGEKHKDVNINTNETIICSDIFLGEKVSGNFPRGIRKMKYLFKKNLNVSENMKSEALEPRATHSLCNLLVRCHGTSLGRTGSQHYLSPQLCVAET